MPRQRLINCTFCGDQDVPRGIEDVLPLWLANKLGYYAQQHHPGTQPSYNSYTYTDLAQFSDDVTGGTGALTQRHVGAVPKAFKLPDVCVECNGGWMSRLETAVGPI